MATFACFSPAEVRETILFSRFLSRHARWTKRNRGCSYSIGILVIHFLIPGLFTFHRIISSIYFLSHEFTVKHLQEKEHGGFDHCFTGMKLNS